MNKPRKHHYLPKFYLRGFSAEGRQLSQIEKTTGKNYVVSLNDVASIRDFYRLETNDDEDDFTLESHLSVVESKLADALCDALENGIHTRAIHEWLVLLISILRLRVPPIRTQVEETVRQIMRSVSVLLHRTNQIPPASPSWIAKLENNEVSIKVNSTFSLGLMFLNAFDEDILNVLLSMQPSIVDAPEDNVFITCDQPVAVFNPSATFNQSHGVALEDPRTEITLPLSTRSLIKLVWAESVPKRTLASSEEVDEYNLRTVISALSYIFTRSDSVSEVCKTVHRFNRYSAGLQTPQFADFGSTFLFRQFYRPVLEHTQYESSDNTCTDDSP